MKKYMTVTAVLLLFVFLFSSCKKEMPVSVSETSKNAAVQSPSANDFSRVSQPGVVYVPLNITLTGNTKAYAYTWSSTVDLDQDTIPDFNFGLSIAWSRGADFYQFVTSINALQPGGGTVSDWTTTALSGLPYNWTSKPLASGTLIDNNLSTYAVQSLPSTYAYSMYFGARKGGTIIGKGDKYVGIRFMSGGITYYGWVRINISSNSRTFIIRDAAFQNTPGLPMPAGAVL